MNINEIEHIVIVTVFNEKGAKLPDDTVFSDIIVIQRTFTDEGCESVLHPHLEFFIQDFKDGKREVVVKLQLVIELNGRISTKYICYFKSGHLIRIEAKAVHEHWPEKIYKIEKKGFQTD